MGRAVRYLFFVLMSSWPVVALAGSEACTNALPKSLERTLSEQYEAYRPVTLQMLSRTALRYYRKDHPQNCPGVAMLDFYGTGKNVYAVLLSSRTGSKRKYQLVVAEMTEGGWKVSPLDSADGGSPVIWTEGPREYKSVNGKVSLAAEHPVIVFVGYESWAVVYAWIGGEVRKTWVSD